MIGIVCATPSLVRHFSYVHHTKASILRILYWSKEYCIPLILPLNCMHRKSYSLLNIQLTLRLSTFGLYLVSFWFLDMYQYWLCLDLSLLSFKSFTTSFSVLDLYLLQIHYKHQALDIVKDAILFKFVWQRNFRVSISYSDLDTFTNLFVDSSTWILM